MATAKQVASGAAIAAVFAAAGAVCATVLRTDPAPQVPGGTEQSAAPPPALRAEEAPAPRASPAPAAVAMDDLGVKPGEWRFLREALVRERVRQEQSRILPEDGGLDILRRAKEAGADVTALLWDYPALRGHIRTGGETKRIDSTGEVTKVNLKEAAGDIAVVEFGPGRFEIDPKGREWSELRKGRKSLEVRGAGMDRTTLVFPGWAFLFVAEKQGLENLSMHDLTLDGAGEAQLIDVRGGASASFERVRFRGWGRAGHSAPIGVSGDALLACRGCEFEGGGEHAYGLSVRGRVLALLQECVFLDMSTVVIGSGEKSTGSVVHVAGGTFENSAVADSRMQRGDRAEIALRVKGGNVRLGPPGLSDQARREQWGASYLAEVEGVTFAPGAPACTLGALLAAAEKTPPKADETLVLFEYLDGGRREPARFGARFRNRATAGLRYARVGPDGDSLDDRSEDHGGGWTLPEPEDLAACPLLVSCVRQSTLSMETSGTVVAFSRNTPGEPQIQVKGERGWPSWALKGKSGEIQTEWGKR